jgi:hypothetical protein
MLVGLALRLAIVKAIRGRTLAGDRVYDSAVETIDDLIRREPSPIVIVSVDEASGDNVAASALLGMVRRLTILIETAVAGAANVPATGDDDGADAIVISGTSQGLEASLDLLDRQVCRCLLTPAAAPWSDLWRRLALRIAHYERKRGGSAESGVRFAARFHLLTLEPIADPAPGVTLDAAGEVWADLVAAMRADADLAGLAEAVDTEITKPEGLADWRVAQALLGVSDADIAGLGITAPDAPQSPVDLVSYTALEGEVDVTRADEVDGPAS